MTVKRICILVSVLCCLSGISQAQPSGGGRPPAGSGSPKTGMPGSVQKPVSLEDMLAPDPFHLWHVDLLKTRASLGLDASQTEAFDAWMRELQDLVTLNERRLWHAVGRSRPVVAARTDFARDLTGELDEANDRASAFKDALRRWTELATLLSPEQHELLNQSYARSRMLASQHPISR